VVWAGVGWDNKCAFALADILDAALETSLLHLQTSYKNHIYICNRFNIDSMIQASIAVAKKRDATLETSLCTCKHT